MSRLLLLGCGGRAGAGAPPVTSYANPGGQGDRTGSITISGTVTAGGGSHPMLVNGTEADEYWWAAGQTSKNMVFDFGTAKVIDEFTWTQGSAIGHGGSNRLEGSNDNSSYTTFAETFTLGTSTTQVIPVTNSTAYRYYRLTVPGATSASPYIREIKFKIA